MKRSLLYMIPVAFWSSTIWAQSSQQMAATMQLLPVPSQQVIERLQQFTHLPSGQWRFHEW